MSATTLRVNENVWERYPSVLDRLRTLTRPDTLQRVRAHNAFVWWVEHLDRQGIELLCPFTYSDESGRVEFEWEQGDRELWLFINTDGPYEYHRLWGENGDRDDEGKAEPADVPRLLLWVMGKD